MDAPQSVPTTEEKFAIINKVIIINCTELQKYRNVRNRLNELTSNCSAGNNVQYSCCGLYQNCESYIFMYYNFESFKDGTNPILFNNEWQQITIPNNDQDFIMALVEQHPEFIMAMLLAIKMDTITEIYDVCTDPKARKGGFMKTIIQTVLSQSINKRVWLGVDPNNEMWDIVIRFYANLGFARPTLTRNAGGSFKPLPLTVIGMSWTKDESPNVPETIKRANVLRDQYKKYAIKCTTRLYLNNDLCNYLREFLKLDREYGGMLVNTGFINDPNVCSSANLALPQTAIVAGNGAAGSAPGVTEATQFMVTDLPPNKITFHTHPNICYQHYGCYIGWPSGPDIANIVYYYPSTIKHYVVTVEGIYAIQLSLDMQLFLNNNLHNFKLFRDTISKEFTQYSSLATEIVSQDVRLITVSDFMSFVGQLTINDLIIRHNIELLKVDTDFAIYNLFFMRWDDIAEKNGMVDCLIEPISLESAQITNYTSPFKPCNVPRVPITKDMIGAKLGTDFPAPFQACFLKC